jgi:acetolactate synthase I/II/III large subunit
MCALDSQEPRMKVYEAVAKALVAEGTQTIFGLMGDANMELLGELSDRDVEFVKVRHEQGAAAMADGYARASGGVGVCTVTCGPGLLNTATSLAVARAHHSGVVVIAGASPRSDPGHLQSFDQDAFGSVCAGRTISLTRAADTGEVVAAAFAAARSGEGPVLVNLPMDVQALDVPEPWHYEPAMIPSSESLAVPDLSEAVAALRGAERPAMIVGRGAVDANAEDAVAALAEAAGAPFVTTLQATGFAGGHPLSLGNAGLMGSPAAFALLEDADCLLVVGASLYRLTTGFGRLLEDARIVLVDIDPAAASKADVFVQGDARAVSEALVLELHRGGWDDRAAAAIQRVPVAPYPFTADHGAGTVDPRSAFVALNRILPSEHPVVMDAGHFISFAGPLLSIRRPRDWIFPTDLGCIGQSTSAAVGVSRARPGERVTVVAGDAGFLMGISELETAARYELPITFFVINDEGWGQEAHVLSMKGAAPELALARTPDLAKLAEGFGATGYTVAGPEDLDGLEHAITTAPGPLVVDVRVNPGVRNWVIEQFALAGHDITETVSA